MKAFLILLDPRATSGFLNALTFIPFFPPSFHIEYFLFFAAIYFSIIFSPAPYVVPSTVQNFFTKRISVKSLLNFGRLRLPPKSLGGADNGPRSTQYKHQWRRQIKHIAWVPHVLNKETVWSSVHFLSNARSGVLSNHVRWLLSIVSHLIVSYPAANQQEAHRVITKHL